MRKEQLPFRTTLSNISLSDKSGDFGYCLQTRILPDNKLNPTNTFFRLKFLSFSFSFSEIVNASILRVLQVHLQVSYA